MCLAPLFVWGCNQSAVKYYGLAYTLSLPDSLDVSVNVASQIWKNWPELVADAQGAVRAVAPKGKGRLERSMGSRQARTVTSPTTGAKHELGSGSDPWGQA